MDSKKEFQVLIDLTTEQFSIWNVLYPREGSRCSLQKTNLTCICGLLWELCSQTGISRSVPKPMQWFLEQNHDQHHHQHPILSIVFRSLLLILYLSKILFLFPVMRVIYKLLLQQTVSLFCCGHQVLCFLWNYKLSQFQYLDVFHYIVYKCVSIIFVNHCILFIFTFLYILCLFFEIWGCVYIQKEISI